MKTSNNKVDLFLDSGAFSAMTQGVSINLEDYIQFIKENEHVIDVYANLDVIGDAAATWKNQRIMEKTGLHPLPCFHYGDDIKWLEKYLQYDYLALGGMVKTPNLIPWLDNLWQKYLTDENGMPKIKVHGFGLTSLKLMLRYPWYSVDSTSWVVTGRMGSIYIPKFKDGQWLYTEDSWKIAVSNKSPDLKNAGQHIETMKQAEKKILLNYLEEKGYKLGKSEYKQESQEYELKEGEKWVDKKPKNKNEKRLVEVIIQEGVSNQYKLRDELNIIYFQDLEKNMKKWPWAFKKETIQSLF